MAFSMDLNLNASPVPDEDEQQPYEEAAEVQYAQEEHVESAVATMRREREERRRRLKREHQDEGSRPHSHQNRNDYVPHQNKRHGRIKEAPQGWLDCPAFGEPIDKIIPSKVPLDETFNETVPPGKRYSSKQLVTKQRKAGREIGLVIDLTNTTRYYSPAEWTKQGTKHVKIPCRGRDAVPDNESVNMFVCEAMMFLDRQKQSKNPKYILVHCTHGHNRTGFMIIHYLMRTHVSCVAEAINIFAQRRPPGIYKRDYIEALYSFYHEVPENMMITCPSTPEWKRPDDLDLNGEAKQDDDEDNGDLAPPHNESEEKVITNDDVLGDAVPYDQQEALRVVCYRLLEMPLVRGHTQFPGSHPVSLNSDNLQLLRQRYYYATWKADGTRYMMLIMRYGCFLIDRNFSFRRVQMRFPHKSQGLHDMTLIDGEMIIDTIPDSGLKRRYLAYDLMALDSVSKTKLPFSDRWKMLEDEIIRPRYQEKGGHKGNLLYKYDMELFSVRRKDFWLLSTVTRLLRDFIPKLSHDADGLIFQGWDDPYVTRTHEGLLKWKYPEMNSVDFLFELTNDNRQLVFLYERGKKKLMDGARIQFPEEIDPPSVAGRIVECSWNKEEQYWVCMRIRADKSTPNDINTYRKVMRSITDNITEEKLLEEIDEIRRLPMYADRIAQAQAKMTQQAKMAAHHRRKYNASI
jgi:mRNA-capping enzyme